MDDGADDQNDRSRASYLRPQGIFSPLVVDYYNRFGRGRELEQYFSLMTASPVSDAAPVVFNSLQEETNYITLRDPVPQTENRGDQTTDCGLQALEVPKIDSTDEKVNLEEQDVQPNLIDLSSDYDSSPRKVDKNQGDISSGSAKQVSPSGSVSSHRKLEWDSLADVGYDNEVSGEKHLSSIEKIALKHRFKEKSTVISDCPQEGLEEPCASSTPITVQPVQHPTVIKKKISVSPVRRKPRPLSSKKTQQRNKSKDNLIRSMINNDLNSDLTHPSTNISVNLSRQYHLNVEFDQGKHDSVSRNEGPEIIIEEAVEKIMSTKESQTNVPEQASTSAQTHEENPIVLSLKSPRAYAFKLPTKKPLRSENRPQPSAAGNIARADSFEYMPGHVYQMQANEPKATSTEYTSSNDSSVKPQKLTDLDKCASLISKILEAHQKDDKMKKRFVKNVLKKLLKTRYVDDETTDSKISSSGSSNDVIVLKRNFNYTDSSASRSDRQSFRDLMEPKTKSERKYLKMKHELIQKKMGDVRRKDSALEQLILLQDELKKLLLDSESKSKDDPRIASMLDRIVLLSTSIAHRRKPPESADDDQSLPDIPPLVLQKSSDESETSNKSEAMREREVNEIFVSNRQQDSSSMIIKRYPVEFVRPSSTRSLPIFKKPCLSGKDEEKIESSGRKSTTLEEDSVSLLASPLIAKDKEFLRTIRDLLREKPTLPPDEFNSKLKQKFEEMIKNFSCDPDRERKSIPDTQNETNEHQTKPESKLKDSNAVNNRHICCNPSCKHRLDPRLKEQHSNSSESEPSSKLKDFGREKSIKNVHICCNPSCEYRLDLQSKGNKTKEHSCCNPYCEQQQKSSESEPSSKLKDSGREKSIKNVHICCNPSCEYRLDLQSKGNKTKEHSCCNPYCEQQQKSSKSEPSSKLKDSNAANSRIKEHICCNPACEQHIDPLQSKSSPKLCSRCDRLRTQHALIHEGKPKKSSRKEQPCCNPTCTWNLDSDSRDGRRKEHLWTNSNSSDSDLNSILRYLCQKKDAAIKEQSCQNPQCQKHSKSVDPTLKSVHKNKKLFESSDSTESQWYKSKQNQDKRCSCPKHHRSAKQSKTTQIKLYPTPIAYNIIFEPHNKDNPPDQKSRRKPLPEVKLRVPKFGEWFDYYRNGETKEIRIENNKENVYCKSAPERENNIRGTTMKQQGSMQNSKEVCPEPANEVSPATSPTENSQIDEHNIRTLQECLAEKKPAFFQCAERRRLKIKENKEQRTKSTEEMNEMVASGIPTPEYITKFYNTNNNNAPLIDDREMRERTTKMVQNLPENQAKNEQIRKDAQYKSYLIKAQIFKKGLQIKTLKGQVNLPIRKTIMTL